MSSLCYLIVSKRVFEIRINRGIWPDIKTGYESYA